MERETHWTLSCLWIRVRLVGGKKKMSASRFDWRRSGHRQSCDSLFNRRGGELWPGSRFPAQLRLPASLASGGIVQYQQWNRSGVLVTLSD